VQTKRAEGDRRGKHKGGGGAWGGVGPVGPAGRERRGAGGGRLVGPQVRLFPQPFEEGPRRVVPVIIKGGVPPWG